MTKHTSTVMATPDSRPARHMSESDHEDDHDHEMDHEDNDIDDSQQYLGGASSSGSTPIKRKRLTQACDPCRKKKIKCDGIKPSCANCAKLDIHCTYLPSMKKRGPRQGYIELLEKRLDKMEKMLQHGPAVIDTDFIDSNISNRRRGSLSDGDSETTETSCSRQELSDPSQHTKLRPDQSPLTRTKRPIYGIKDEVPRKDILDHLIQLFFDSVYYQFPVIHPGSFMKQYREGKVSPNLLNALCAGVARFSNHPDVVTTPSFLAGEPFATNVRASLIDSVDVPTVSNVQALLFLSMFEYGAARGPRAWMFGGMAIRMAQELGLNREDSSPVFNLKGDWVLRETRRRTFWACFIMDVLASSSSGRPRMIDERDCEVLLPSEDNAWHEARPVVTEMLEEENDSEGLSSVKHETDADDTGSNNAPDSWPGTSTKKNGSSSAQPSKEDEASQKCHSLSSFAYLIRILAILGKVSQYVNRPRTKKSIPPNEPGSEFAIIDAALAAWLQSVPSQFGYSPDNTRMLKDRGEGCIIIFMHVVYHTSVVLLHRPILAADKASFPMDPEFVENSTKRCAEAAAKVSEVLEFVTAQNYPPRIYISSFFAYPVFTTATIHITNAFASDPAIAAKARRNLSIHVKILQTMKTYWAMADKFFYIIRDLYSIQSKISSSANGGIIVPQVVSHNPYSSSRNYAADSEVNPTKNKEASRTRGKNGKNDESSRAGLEGDSPAPRMVVNSKLASISSFLKSDSGLIALWRRATEMQVIDEANQQKRRILATEDTNKNQSSTSQIDNTKDQEEKEQKERLQRMNQLEIQEINQEFERQRKAKMLEEQQQQVLSNKDCETSESQLVEKRQAEDNEPSHLRASKQARVTKTLVATATVATAPQPSHAPNQTPLSNLSSVGSLDGSANPTWSPGLEQSPAQPMTPLKSNSNSNMTYRHTVLQGPDQLQQFQGREGYIMQPLLVQTSVPSLASAAKSDMNQHLLNVYTQQHQQQEALSQAIDMRQNANIQKQQQRLQQQRQQAPVSSSLAFGPPGGLNTSLIPSVSASVQQQQMAQYQPQHQHQQRHQHQHHQQPGMAPGSGFGPPLVYGSSYSHNQSSRAQAEMADSIFDFAMPLGDLNFLSSSFQMTPMMMHQNSINNNSSVSSSAAIGVSTSLSTIPLRSAHGPLTADTNSSPSAPSPVGSTTSSSAASMLMPGPEPSTDLSPVRGRAASDSKSPPTSTQNNISPGLHSFMMSDEAFSDMQSTPDSLVRYLNIHHEQLRQEMQLQQQDIHPVLNQQNSLIYDDYFHLSQLLPNTANLTQQGQLAALHHLQTQQHQQLLQQQQQQARQKQLQPLQQQQQQQQPMTTMRMEMDTSIVGRPSVHTSIPSFQ
ncbi:hypothetical protein BX616_011255 [Lobosporangium transversale]|uniref:Fungal-specific transcription factor domain-domain-containing protein n=1 Tax=Lobosporangium transversale TaxID=64571 RepID=A0A1Y2GTB8_9FUNG|nr:fungal-specific transcription factor domain-domain-containing protein [Lobosporangium transversale]KAF9909228.1 hypothetical protein BX616_011255 [Lobosporangium transversale]ORZ22767.1 fungal-specific transcription factor domain-domain-containing protein [Lobosporangium transversale]|eukprot:XP_021883321.1 fungal-specific transcription factor domain-domain-containing protein [Lobosporangium transversale]